MNRKSTIVVIDDHPLFRRGASQLIAMDNSLELVGEAAGGAEGIALLEYACPDLVLLDLNMKGMDGLETLQVIKQNKPDCRVVMLTVSDEQEDVVAALRLGADGYLLKDAEPEDVLASLKRAVEGRLVLDDRVFDYIALALRTEAVPRTPAEAALTRREHEILLLIAEGLSNKLIARDLEITENTVKVHVKHLLRKLNLRTRVEAAVWATKHE